MTTKPIKQSFTGIHATI